jgi:CHAT domain-containing protein
VDLLLRRADDLERAASPDPAALQALLREARDTVERHRAGELRDYLRNECVEELERKARPIDEIAADAAAIYPVSLPDRTEILLGLPSGLRRVRVDVGAAALREETRTLRRLLEKRTTREYLPHAQRLYDRLVRSLEPALAAAEVTTLVVVPGGPLRTIPLAALHDGERFVAERWAVATAPGLAITDPRPFPREGAKALVAGLSSAGDGHPALPEVPREVGAVGEIWGATALLDADFTAPRAEAALAGARFTLLHVASHAEITADARRSVLWAHDGALPLDRLATWIGVARYRAQPVEILVLSACSTAAGDERAALGLAGVAVQAGARSAVGTLWKVPDASAADLVVAFHRALHEPGVSRAEALRRAQRALLARPDTAHPAHWAAFLLVSAWL